MNTDLLCTFAQVNDTDSIPYFATITNDQRVKIWSTTTNALHMQLTEAQHLGVSYTSLALVVGTHHGVR